MAEKPAAERTEKPTARRLQKARESGQVPHGQELAAAVTLVVLLLTVALLAPSLFAWCQSKIESGLSCDTSVFTNTETFLAYQNKKIIEALVVMLPILAALCAAGLATSMAIGGWTFAPKAIQFKWNAINPSAALQNAFSTRSVVRLLMSIAKLAFVGLIVWFYLRDRFDTLAGLRWAWSTQIIAAIAKIILGLGLRVGIATIILGLADTLYQKWHYIEDLKMTRQEVKQEHKDTEGDPKIKSRIRRIQFEMSMRRIRKQVPKASVILVNPTHVAVALQYEPKTMDAPVLLTKGADHIAHRIVEIGRSYGIPIVRRPAVARAIYASVKPGQAIPQSLYIAVAEVLAMIYRLRQRKKAIAKG
jgi:flagellar biosynthetic protein FlhB